MAVSLQAPVVQYSFRLDDTQVAVNPWIGQRLRLEEDGARLHDLLAGHGLRPTGGCSLFQWWVSEHAALLHEYLACHGILVRLFAVPSSLRFGLPAEEADWLRLAAALQDYRKEQP